uniref:Uncharacterized protein n=1 Tax=Cyprinodon variegatus TaxID=28743 RepID=A0A3Q2FWE3_CYPVA
IMQLMLLFSRQGKQQLQKSCTALDNKLITLGFGSLYELDIMFNFEKAYFILDKFLMGEIFRTCLRRASSKPVNKLTYCRKRMSLPGVFLSIFEMGLAYPRENMEKAVLGYLCSRNPKHCLG